MRGEPIFKYSYPDEVLLQLGKDGNGPSERVVIIGHVWNNRERWYDVVPKK